MAIDPTIQAKAAMAVQTSGTGKVDLTWSAAIVTVPVGMTISPGGILTTAQVAQLNALAIASIAAVITAAQEG